MDEEVPSGKREVRLNSYCQHFIVPSSFSLSPNESFRPSVLLWISPTPWVTSKSSLLCACVRVSVLGAKSNSGSNVGGFCVPGSLTPLKVNWESLYIRCRLSSLFADVTSLRHKWGGGVRRGRGVFSVCHRPASMAWWSLINADCEWEASFVSPRTIKPVLVTAAFILI